MGRWGWMVGNCLYRLLLSISSTFLLISIFLVKSKLYFIKTDYNWVNNLILLSYFLIPVLLTWLSIYLSKFLSKDSFISSEVNEIEYAGNSFLPSYLGYFFVALSIADKDFLTIIVLYSILFIFVFLSKTFYFNPVFLIFGYHFYQIKTSTGLKVFLITKKTFKKKEDVNSNIVYRVNDFTFIER